MKCSWPTTLRDASEAFGSLLLSLPACFFQSFCFITLSFFSISFDLISFLSIIRSALLCTVYCFAYSDRFDPLSSTVIPLVIPRLVNDVQRWNLESLRICLWLRFSSMSRPEFYYRFEHSSAGVFCFLRILLLQLRSGRHRRVAFSFLSLVIDLY